MAGRPTKLSDRVKIMVELIEKQKYTRTEILDKVYVMGGCVANLDGSKVCIHIGKDETFLFSPGKFSEGGLWFVLARRRGS